MNKRIVSLILSIVMTLSILVSAVPVMATESSGLSASVTGASEGGVFTVTLRIPKVDEDLENTQIKVEFDKTVFEAVTVPTAKNITYEAAAGASGISTVEEMNTNGFFAFNLVGSGIKIGEGAEVSANFKVKAGATVGSSHEFTLTQAMIGNTDEVMGLPNIILNLSDFEVKSVTVAVTKAVTGVTVDETLTLKTGESKKLTVTVSPEDASNKAVTYAVTAGDAATVDADGNVTGVKKGTATITVTTADGGFTATCEVTVECVHTGGTATCQKQAECDLCGESYGELADHNPASTWTKDETGHWHACQTEGCTEKCDFSEHTPDHEAATDEYPVKCTVCDYTIQEMLEHTCVFDKEVAEDAYKASDATCQKKATYYKSCKCGKAGEETFEYGELANHNWSDEWTKDETGHWYACLTEGCTEKGSFAQHTPDHEGGASEEYPVKCTVCDYLIHAQLAHTCVFDKEVAEDEYKASDATCQKKATYYKSCRCGEKGEETFEYGELANHNWADEWTKDETGHWYACLTEGCTEKGSFAQHTPDHDAASEEYPVKCTVCDYVIHEQLEHIHAFDKEVAEDEYKASNATCQKKATYYKSCRCGEKGEETFEYGELADHNWNEATCTEPKNCEWCGLTEGEALEHVPSDWKYDADGHWKVCTRENCGATVEEKTAHADEDGDGNCDKCGYLVAVYYTFRFDANGGEGEMDEVTVVEGEEYDLPACTFTAPSGKKFAGWIYYGEVLPEGATVIVENNALLKATWQRAGTMYERFYAQLVMLHNRKYNITASAGEGGSITPEGITKVKFQRSITYTITPDAGYAIKAVIVDGKDVGAVSEYSFKTVRGAHTIKAEFEAKSPYTDVYVNDWYYDDVLFVTEEELMNGTGSGKFSPAVTTDRAMIVTVLWRLEGSPVVDGEIQFEDVEAGQWYTEAIKWAAANEIVNGYGNGKFGPENEITREQVMAILNRYADYKGYADAEATSAEGYTVSEWAEGNVAWAEANGLTKGLGVDITDMTAKADRAEIAAYLTRFVKALIK